MLTHGSLFAGIGGFDLGFERAGIKTLWQVENDPYCLKVLERHWPNVQRYGGIKEIRWEDVEVPDIVSGGFPCQPVSVAGKRKGTDDERWLWPEFARCLRILRPRYAVLENVPGLLALGFGDVLGDLAALGYDAEWDCIPAAAFGAPHLRYRVWVVAYGEGNAERPGLREGATGAERRRRPGDGGGALADAEGKPGEIRETPEKRQGGFTGGGKVADADPERCLVFGLLKGNSNRFNQEGNAGGAGPVSSGNNSARRWWAVEPNVGRVANGIPARVDRLKCLGNAIVPQVAEWLGKRILEFENPRVY